jgi:S-(hydroxymethyl)glutathione dehydrogenase/alcohol dehydrogenase
MTTMSGLGTFSEVMVVDEISLVKVETDLPSDQLALIGCGIMTGVGAALNTAQVVPGSTVAVFGCGGVGQAVIQGARIAGASRIVAVDPVAMKRETALALGATDTVDPNEGDPSRAVRAMLGGRGADYTFEVIGLPETMLQAWRAARPGGTAVMVGMPRSDAQVSFPAFLLFASERRTLGSLYGSAQVRRDFPRMVSLVETGRLDIASMVSRHIHLEDVNDAFAAMENGETIRSVIRNG